MKKVHGLLAVVAVVFGLVSGCGDESTEGPNGGESSARCESDEDCPSGEVCTGNSEDGCEVETDAGIDSGSGDGSVVETGGRYCPDTVECVTAADCEVAGAAGRICEFGCCQSDVSASTTCVRQSQTCRGPSYSNDEYFCDPQLNLCLTRCSVYTFSFAPTQFCPLQTICTRRAVGEVPRDPATVCAFGMCEQF
jgi:hypothetical protein